MAPKTFNILEASAMSKSLSSPIRIMAPLSDQDVDELDQFLMSDLTSDETLMLDSLDGYLTAIAIGPAILELNHWLPGVWGPGKDSAPDVETTEQAQRILDLILQHYNGIILRLNDPDGFEPVLDKVAYRRDAREYIEGEPWALGFMDGVALRRQSWQPLFDDPQGREWIRPLYLLGADNLTSEEEALTRWPHQRDELARKIPASIAAIYRYWTPAVRQPSQLANTIQRPARHVGRHDPCPCDTDAGREKLGIFENLADLTESHANGIFKTNFGGKKRSQLLRLS
jgi:uncharacterized protein